MMPWCEYLIKCYAYHRKQKDKWEHTRFIAYHAMIGSHLKPSAIPKTLENFLPLGKGKAKKVSNEVRERFFQEYKEYLEKKK